MDSYLRPSRISNVTQTYSDSSKRILRTKAGKTNSPRISRLLFTAITDNGPRSNVLQINPSIYSEFWVTSTRAL